MNTADTISIKIGNTEHDTTLTDLLETELDEIAEVRSSALPEGIYELRAMAPREGQEWTKRVEVKDKPARAAIVLGFEVINVLALADKTIDASSLIGKRHDDSFFMTNMPDDLGRLKAFMTDTGFVFEQNERLMSALPRYVGTEFEGSIRHRVNPNDKDMIYVNINREQKKLKPKR